MPRVYLSPPHVGEAERALLLEAFDSNWIAPLGPQVDAFEREFAARVGVPHALALSSGTAALHLGLIGLGVGAGDTVLVSDLTFAATANAVRYVGAEPVFIDSDEASWNMSPTLLEEELTDCARRGKVPRAVIAVDLYGQCADLGPIRALCTKYGVPLIEDAAEALGATYGDVAAGAVGDVGVFSFNGNKIITTSGGGMLVSRDKALVDLARNLSMQAREPAAHYEHRRIGFNYRMSNLLAALGRGQLRNLDDFVAKRRDNYTHYTAALGQLPGVRFMPQASFGRPTCWLTCLTIDPRVAGVSHEDVRLGLEREDIEARPVWKPMHLQPVFASCRVRGGDVGARLFAQGLCLPSGSSLSATDRERVVHAVRQSFANASNAAIGARITSEVRAS